MNRVGMLERAGDVAECQFMSALIHVALPVAHLQLFKRGGRLSRSGSRNSCALQMPFVCRIAKHQIHNATLSKAGN